MLFRKLESKLNTQNQTFWVFGYTGKERVRKPLGTERAGIGDTRVEWIKRACEEGANSAYWPQLKECLPLKSFAYFAEKVGYKDAPAVEPKREATWADLRASYISALDHKILDGAMTESTKTNYVQSLKAFDEFVALRGISTLAQITEEVVVEDFKPWRKRGILARKNSGKKAGRLAFDLTILRAAWSHTKSKTWGKLGFVAVNNPVPSMNADNKPGANPEEPTMPFTADELMKLRTAASLKTYSDSKEREYKLPHGTDLLAFELMLRTGLRRCDVATLQWKHVRFDMGKAGMIRVAAKKNGEDIFLPIHSELAPVLRAEKARRNPNEHDTVLINPQTGEAYDVNGKGLYRRMTALGERLGIEEVRPHRFRCSFAVDALMKGASPNQIAQWLGDTVETVVKHYLPISTAMSEQTRNTLERKDAGIEAMEPVGTVHERRTLLNMQVA
jgi:integrase